MATQTSKALADQINKAFQDQDWDFFKETLSDDFTWKLIGYKTVGRKEFFDMMKDMPPESTFTPTNIVMNDDYIVVESDGPIAKLKDREQQHYFCDIYKIKDGKIIHMTSYMDTALMQEEDKCRREAQQPA
ncbi:ketosteroid isomerase-like protein [Chitinophaga skermanii]|uniref:Ketosteroid isomerase-like protein n=1 Tax=Chitinophaga skermanii TaxID=331697 RepID=A0A327QQB4_9BACT|nr:nuclear transport factor 2 family protein [Chitinophaga skermanii]RAJ06540.1 ketosteroid isomerase-like protein [Chitinophaga skermanii]